MFDMERGGYPKSEQEWMFLFDRRLSHLENRLERLETRINFLFGGIAVLMFILNFAPIIVDLYLKIKGS